MIYNLVVIIVGCVGLNNSVCKVTPYAIKMNFDSLTQCEKAAASLKVPSNYGIYIEKACVAENNKE